MTRTQEIRPCDANGVSRSQGETGALNLSDDARNEAE